MLTSTHDGAVSRPPMTLSTFARAGAIGGAAGGTLMAIVLRAVGEGPLGDAVALEHGAGGAMDELYSRSMQQVGGMLGAAAYGVAIGLIFGIVLASVRHRLPGDDWTRALTLAAVGFTTVVLVPFLKYPANPPTVGSPDTISDRTVLYLTFLLYSVVTTTVAAMLLRRLRTRWSRAEAVPATVLVFVGLLAVGYLLFPPFSDPVRPPANLVWHFRTASLLGHASLWVTLSLTAGAILLRRGSAKA